VSPRVQVVSPFSATLSCCLGIPHTALTHAGLPQRVSVAPTHRPNVAVGQL
jgi:hypothetical protein